MGGGHPHAPLPIWDHTDNLITLILRQEAVEGDALIDVHLRAVRRVGDAEQRVQAVNKHHPILVVNVGIHPTKQGALRDFKATEGAPGLRIEDCHLQLQERQLRAEPLRPPAPAQSRRFPR